MSQFFCRVKWVLAGLFVALVVGWGNSSARSADDPSAKPPPAGDNASQAIAQLVEQLGSPSYRVREHATSELSKLGLAAKPALLAGLQSADAEVRLRCQRVLGAVLEQDYQARLAAFAADKEGVIDHQLPGWGRFKQQIGGTPEARGLFVEMLKAEPALMEATESKPERASEVLSARCHQVQEMLYGANFGERKQPSLGTLTALFFLAADKEVAIEDQTNNYLGNFSYQQSIQGSINSGPRADLLRKLLGAWVGRNNGSSAVYQCLALALRYELREGLEPALIACKQPGGQPVVLMHAVLVVAKFGNKEHVPVLEPLLENTGVCINYNVNNEMFKTEVRDISLAVAVHLTGQDLKEYGFSRIEKNQMYLFNPSSMGFRENDPRPGLDKWKAWSEEQKKTPKGS